MNPGTNSLQAFDMYFIYVIQSQKDGRFYTGFTTNLKERINEHSNGCQLSTRSRRPFQLIYYEWCLNKEDAVARERYLKSGMGKRYLKQRVKNYLVSLPK